MSYWHGPGMDKPFRAETRRNVSVGLTAKDQLDDSQMAESPRKNGEPEYEH
jgi:hypothetical protein